MYQYFIIYIIYMEGYVYKVVYINIKNIRVYDVYKKKVFYIPFHLIKKSLKELVVMTFGRFRYPSKRSSICSDYKKRRILMTNIKSFVVAAERQYVKLTYSDKPKDFIDTKVIIGYGIVTDKWGDHVEPFYRDEEMGIISPIDDASNLIVWEIL